MLNNKQKQKFDPQEALFNAFGFIEADLAFNQSGKLSDGQRRVQQQFRALGMAYWGVVLIFVLSIVWLLANIYHPNPIAMTLFVGSTVLLLVSTGFGFWDINAIMNVHRMLRENQVNMVEGRIIMNTIPRRTYLLYIDRMRFRLNRRQFLAFRNGDPYRLYYTPGTRRILSVVWLPGEDPFISRSEAEDEMPVDLDYPDTNTSQKGYAE